MTNRNQLTREEQIALAEYQVCQQSQNSTTQSYWTLSGIFIGFTSALLGGLIYGVLSNNELIQILLKNEVSINNKEFLVVGIIAWVLSMVVLIVLYFLKGWLKRVNFLTQLNYKRMREIEFKLKMRKSSIVHAIDDWDKLKVELEKLAKVDKASIINDLKEFYKTHKKQIEERYELPSGRWHHKWIFGALFFLWGLLLAVSIYLLYQFACCLAASLAIIGVIVWLSILFWEEIKTKHRDRSKLEAR
jgi:hypothetical protein